MSAISCEENETCYIIILLTWCHVMLHRYSVPLSLYYYGLRDTTASYAVIFLNIIPLVTFIISLIFRCIIYINFHIVLILIFWEMEASLNLDNCIKALQPYYDC